MRNVFFAAVSVVISLSACTKGQVNWHPLLTSGDIYDEKPQPYQHSFSSIVAQQYQPQHQFGGGQCDLYKVGFAQDSYFQYIQYKVELPALHEFTLCYWNKFANHSNDHPIFSYAVEGQPKAIQSWVSNTARSSYYSLSVDGHTFYRLNYPLRLNRWYHTCQSWNGKTGEWQIWVNAERVGRGFHNRLVGHVIPGGGTAITGQEQGQIGGGFQEGREAPKGSGGMLGEVTMLQLYKVALTAGKAHKDHKHHHAHRYDHNGAEITTTPAPVTTNRPTPPAHPLITGGQLNPGAALNIAAQQPQLIQGQQFTAQFLNGQFAPALVGQQLSAVSQEAQTFPQQAPQQQVQQQVIFQDIPSPSKEQTQDFDVQSQAVQFLGSQPDLQNEGAGSFSQQTFTLGGRPLLNSGLINHQALGHDLYKREQREKRQTEKSKRELILAGGHLIDDSVLTNDGFDQNLLAGLAGIGENEPVLQQQMKMEEREPAEAEVKAVMSICSGCDPEPFAKALILDWRSVPKKLYSGALYMAANTECRVF